MALFTWNDSYSVKVATCDAQHKKLFEIMNELADAMQIGRGKDVIAKTVGELAQYTRVHFRQEEELMRKAGYPQLASHQVLHRSFEEDVAKLHQDLHRGRSANAIEVLDMLRGWLLNHIVKVDKTYSDHLNTAGMR